MESRSTNEHEHHTMDNTYATIQPRMGNHSRQIELRRVDMHPPNNTDFADYATLRTNRPPSVIKNKKLFI